MTAYCPQCKALRPIERSLSTHRVPPHNNTLPIVLKASLICGHQRMLVVDETRWTDYMDARRAGVV